MSGLPNIPQLTRSDVREAPAWADPILKVLNSTRDYLVSAFNGGIDVSNLRVHIRELEVRTGATYTSGVFTAVTFQTGIKAKLIDVRVLQVIDLDDPEAVLSGNHGIDWRDDAGLARVRWISGLRASKRYWVRFEAR